MTRIGVPFRPGSGQVDSVNGQTGAVDLTGTYEGGRTSHLYVATDGSDSNHGKTWGKAFLTVGAAIAALPAGGGIVEIGPGTFTGVAATNPGNNVVITGQGRGITILVAVNVILGAVFDGTSVSNVTIQRMTIDGNQAGQSVAGGRACVRFITSTTIRTYDLECKNAKQDGAYFSGCADVRGDIHAHDNGRNGVSFGDSNGVSTSVDINVLSSGHTVPGAIGLSLEPAQRAKARLISTNDYNPVVIGGGAANGSNDNFVDATVSAPTNTAATIINGTAGATGNLILLTGSTSKAITGNAAKTISRNRIVTTIPPTDALGAAPVLNVATGSYWSYPVAHSTVVTIAGALYLHPVYIARDMTADRIGAEVTAAAASSTCALLIYDSHLDTGRPSTLVLNAGTIDGNSATAQELTISQALVGGRVYWIGMLVLGGTPTVRCASSASSMSWSGEQGSLTNALGAGSVRFGRTQTGLGSVPDPANTTLPGSSIPLIALRVG